MTEKYRKIKKRLNEEVVVRNGEVSLYNTNSDSKDVSALSVDDSNNLYTADKLINYLRGRSKYSYGTAALLSSEIYETKEEAEKAHKILLGAINSLCEELEDLTQRVTAIEELIKAILTKPYLKVSPKKKLWISPDITINYSVKSNAEWTVE